MPLYLSEKHLKDLHDSGLEDEIINQCGFYTASPDDVRRILDRRDIDCECLIIPYPGIADYFRVKPDGIILGRDGKPSKYLQKANTESKLYIYPEVRNELTTANYTSLPILIVEGEKKALKATQDLYIKEKVFLPVGISGVWNWRTTKVVRNKKGESELVPEAIDDLKNIIIDNRLVYICFDSDIVVNEQVQHAENELGKHLLGRGATRVLCIRIPNEEKKLGLDDYIVRYGVDKFKELIQTAKSSHVIKYSIKMLRKFPNLTLMDKLDYITNLVLKDQVSCGNFYYDNNGSYFFSNADKRVIQIEEEEYRMRVAEDYGLYRDTSEFRNVLSKVEEHAIFTGEKISIKNFSYYDVNNEQIYVYDNNGSSHVIDKDSVKKVYNGTGKVFFKHRDFTPIKYYAGQRGYFNQYILDVCNFQATEYTELTPDQQRFLFKVWFYSLFFPNLLPTKPILVMTGDYGSGKSTIQRLVGKLLFGSNFNVSTIQGERDFLTSIINKYYLVFDNVDISEEWVRNAIASLSTGFKVEVRKLYSDLEMFQADPIAYLALNSMTQSLYKRPDVANRLLIFRTKRIEKFIPPYVLEKNVVDFRDEILSEVFDDLQKIIPYIDDKFTYNGVFRMADFANLGLKISTSLNNEKEFLHILEVMSAEQSMLPMEDNPLVDLIDKWILNRVSSIYISTGDLYAELKRIAEDKKLFFPFKSSVSFGRTLQTAHENLKNFYKIDCRRGHGNKLVWMIENKERKGE